ncbi:MAG: hypothetical protein JOY68_00190 [Candidatus Dormibacteraeota bacterium]|nr:hypothetical protein [Candidatus Dormibacteraeota bacterium]
MPLYAVEMVRVLADRGVVVPREGGYEVAGPLGDVVIPDSLHALIQSRLDSLPAEERSLLQDAAVVGQTLTLAALAAVSRRDAPGIETQLRRLVRKELVSVDADPRSPERGQYGFVQSLIREVAYGTLARRERSAKHLAAARHFEGLGDEELAGVVAAHYVEAHRSAPEGADTAEVAAQARRWLSEAGRRALTLGSPEQALVFFEQALEVTSDAADRAPLLRLAGDAALRTSNPEQAAVYLGEAAELFASLGDRTAAGSAAAQRVRALSALSRYTEAIEQGMRASESLGSDDDEARADLGAALSDAHSASASPQEALRWAETALAAAERVEGPTLLLRAIFSRVWALYNAGRHREAGILAQGLVELAERAGVLAGQARGLMAVSLLRLHDEPRVTLEACAEAAALARRVGERPLETSNLLNAAETGIFKGYWADARAAIADVSRRDLRTDHRIWLETLEALLLGLSTDARAGLEELSHNAENQLESQYLASRTTFLRIRAFLCLAADEFEAAREDVAQLVAADPSGINTALALAIQARAALWMRDREGARATVEAMAGFHGRWMATARQTVEAGLAALEGRVAEASGAYRQAVETWRTLDVPLDLALCDIDMVDLLGPQSADMSAAAEAEEILTRLGATPFLERLRHLRARATISA